jgi:hypothetical protein
MRPRTSRKAVFGELLSIKSLLTGIYVKIAHFFQPLNRRLKLTIPRCRLCGAETQDKRRQVPYLAVCAVSFST